MKTFEIPSFYRSPIISRVKEIRKTTDPRKKDFSPTLLDFGPVQFIIARHFGFCYGVENAIEISYRALEENPDKRIFLLSQMIHNPEVNNDLLARGVRFIMDTHGTQLIPWEELHSGDIVIIPAFGTTLDIEKKLTDLGISIHRYNTTCPFVERVWNRAEKLGKDAYSIVIHGKHRHEETRATFSHSRQEAPSVVVKDLSETKLLGDIIRGTLPAEEFYRYFAGRYSEGFEVTRDLQRIGVINQTTMLATETQEIADYLRQVMVEKYPTEPITAHFADTRDTLCYATNDNQQATYGLLQQEADLALVIGGYNSSNTTHLVELLEPRFATYFIHDESQISDEGRIRHFDIHHKTIQDTASFLPVSTPARIVLTSGASCPDSVVDRVMLKMLSFFPGSRTPEEALALLAG